MTTPIKPFKVVELMMGHTGKVMKFTCDEVNVQGSFLLLTNATDVMGPAADPAPTVGMVLPAGSVFTVR